MSDTDAIVTSFCADSIHSFGDIAVAAMLVSNSAAPTLLSVDCDADNTFSVIAFIILYGLLLVPRNDFGKYWASMDGEYSGAGGPAVVVVATATSSNIVVS